MIRSHVARSLVVAAAFVPAVFGLVSARSAAPVRVPVTIEEVHSLEPGPLTRTTCEEAKPCIAIPLVVKGLDETGEERTLVTAYPVGPQLVKDVADDFRDVTDVVLRNLRPSLATGVKAKDHATRLVCKQSIAGVDTKVKYRLNKGVKMPIKVETTVARIAKKAAERLGKPIVVTSATRSPKSQAAAMRNKIALGDNVMKLYADKKSAWQVLSAYKEAKRAGASKEQVTERMAEVIEDQVDRGVYLSNHLREGAIDIRTKDLSHWERKELVAAVQDVPGVRRTILETIPPHLHLELE
jgi:uncharacterized protein YcbK (DUF882 family)